MHTRINVVRTATRSDEFQATPALVPAPTLTTPPHRIARSSPRTCPSARTRRSPSRRRRRYSSCTSPHGVSPAHRHPPRHVPHCPLAVCHSPHIARLLFLPLALASCLSPLAERTVCAVSVVPRAPPHFTPSSPVAHLAVPHIADLTAPSCSARTRSPQRQRLRRVVRADNGQRTRRAGRDQGSWVRGVCAEGAASD